MNGRIILVTVALALFAGSAGAQGWSIGSNVGFSVLSPKSGGDKIYVFGAPSSAGPIVPSFQPGLRFGVPVGAGENEGYFDLGLSVLGTSGGGGTSTGYQVTANLQHNFKTNGAAWPYVNLGGGVMGQSFSAGESMSNPILGGGIGVLEHVGNGHGAVRAEVRYDYVFKDPQGFEGGALLGIKLGFDLYMK